MKYVYNGERISPKSVEYLDELEASNYSATVFIKQRKCDNLAATYTFLCIDPKDQCMIIQDIKKMSEELNKQWFKYDQKGEIFRTISILTTLYSYAVHYLVNQGETEWHRRKQGRGESARKGWESARKGRKSARKGRKSARKGRKSARKGRKSARKGLKHRPVTLNIINCSNRPLMVRRLLCSLVIVYDKFDSFQFEL